MNVIKALTITARLTLHCRSYDRRSQSEKEAQLFGSHRCRAISSPSQAATANRAEDNVTYERTHVGITKSIGAYSQEVTAWAGRHPHSSLTSKKLLNVSARTETEHQEPSYAIGSPNISG